jgi:hypothetical protein
MGCSTVAVTLAVSPSCNLTMLLFLDTSRYRACDNMHLPSHPDLSSPICCPGQLRSLSSPPEAPSAIGLSSRYVLQPPGSPRDARSCRRPPIQTHAPAIGFPQARTGRRPRLPRTSSAPGSPSRKLPSSSRGEQPPNSEEFASIHWGQLTPLPIRQLRP